MKHAFLIFVNLKSSSGHLKQFCFFFFFFILEEMILMSGQIEKMQF